MRAIRVSLAYLGALHRLLAFGETQFGSSVVDAKRALISRTIHQVLANHPAIGAFDASLGLFVHLVLDTPFLLFYDFDDVEQRIHLIVHRRADCMRVDPLGAEW